MGRIKLITTIDKNGCLVEGNNMLYDLPSNLLHFKHNTKGKSIVYGRLSYEIISSKLDNDKCYVLSTKIKFNDKKIKTFKSLKLLQEYISKNDEDIYVVGGLFTINEFIKYNLLDELIITHIHDEFNSGLKLNMEVLDLSKWVITNNIYLEENNIKYNIINYIKPKKRFY